MAAITLINGQPFVTVVLYANNRQLRIERALLDTGSATSVFDTDDLATIDVLPEDTDFVRFLTGIGGQEPVVEKLIDRIEVGDITIGPMTIEMGELQYGYQIQGIVGMNFLLQVGATINLRELTLS